ncbi:hypothetical protein WMF11_32000 [Sorangium sp. So ce295]|uniref:hypothetical protein n=1 Tax=Sorangium sp. So ce295 TaxID=3133295 RepID=UPI003F626408
MSAAPPPPAHPATVARETTVQPKLGEGRPPHPASVQRKAAEPPQKSTRTSGPHPATVQRKAAEPPQKSTRASGPHPAAVQRKTAEPPQKPTRAPGPHPAAVKRDAAAQPKTAATSRGPHAATVKRAAAAQPKKAGAARAPHPAQVVQRMKLTSSAESTGKGWNKNTLLDNLEATLGKDWVAYVTKGLEAIVVYEGPGLYDSTQRVVFIDARQTESEATQQLVMELSNHQNRGLLAELDSAAQKLTREDYIEKVERVEFAGVTNVIRTYDAAVQLELGWAKGGCVYGKMRGLSFEKYYTHVSQEHRERYGKRYDNLTKKK